MLTDCTVTVTRTDDDRFVVYVTHPGLKYHANYGPYTEENTAKLVRRTILLAFSDMLVMLDKQMRKDSEENVRKFLDSIYERV